MPRPVNITDIPFEALDDALYNLSGDVEREIEFAFESEENALLPADIQDRYNALTAAAFRVLSFGAFYGIYVRKDRNPLVLDAPEDHEA